MDTLMEGLTVLSQQPEMTTDFNLLAFIIAAVVILVISILIGTSGESIEGAILFFVFAVFFAALITFAASPKVPTGRIISKVTVADTVSMNDFNAKYQILSQEGLIYEIVEKDVE